MHVKNMLAAFGLSAAMVICAPGVSLRQVMAAEEGVSEGETTDETEEETVNGTASITIPDLAFDPEPVPDTEGLAFVRSMRLGWNLGNTMDAFTGKTPKNELDTETSWQPVRTTREVIRAAHEAGFETIRIPVSWHNHVDKEFNISEAWLDRVQEIVDYAVDEGMTVIVNIHHDNDENVGCLFPDSEHLDQSMRFVGRIWEQVAERFADYDGHLVFEAMNEPRLVGHANEWSLNLSDPEVADAVDCINRLNQLFVDTVRASGGNNEERFLMVPGYDASPDGVLTDAFIMPEDSADDRLILSVHAYTPYNFALNLSGTDHFDASESASRRDIVYFMDRLYKKYVSRGVPVVIGEFGALDKGGNLRDRVDYAAFYIAYARSRGITACWWDNGAFSGNGEIFGLLDRKACRIAFPDIMEALDRYAGE